MVNPLRGFIFHDRLFEEIDNRGIQVQKNRENLFARMIDALLGRIEVVTICGDSITVDRASAEDFFLRNASLLKGIISEESSIQEKIVRLYKEMDKRKMLPHGILAERSQGGEEARRMIIGTSDRFRVLIEALENNGFIVESIKATIEEKESDGCIHIEREEFFRAILEENRDNLDQLQAQGWQEIRKLSQLLINRLTRL